MKLRVIPFKPAILFADALEYNGNGLPNQHIQTGRPIGNRPEKKAYNPGHLLKSLVRKLHVRLLYIIMIGPDQAMFMIAVAVPSL